MTDFLPQELFLLQYPLTSPRWRTSWETGRVNWEIEALSSIC